MSYVGGDGVTLAGGWAAWGATTGEMARNIEAVDADVLVVMAGTNDVALGAPFTESASNIADKVTTVGASEVIIAGIPPIDRAPPLASSSAQRVLTCTRSATEMSACHDLSQRTVTVTITMTILSSWWICQGAQKRVPLLLRLSCSLANIPSRTPSS